MSQKPVHALLVNRIPILRKAMADVLVRAGVSNVECLAGLPCDRRVSPGKIDLVVASLDALEHHGPTAFAELRRRFADSFLVVTAQEAEGRRTFDYLAKGADGFVPKTLEISDMVDAFRSVLSGRIYVPEVDRDAHLLPAQSLTERQASVLRHVQEGLTNKEVARKLGISPETVKVHLNNAYRTIGVHNRTAAIAALETGRAMPARAADSDARSYRP